MISEFTAEKNDGACDYYTKEELDKYGRPEPLIIRCPKCGCESEWNGDNTYKCKKCSHVFYTERIILI